MNLDPDKLRDLPGWKNNAPVPICMGGDYRALTFCCKPGFSLTFGYKCRRDEALQEIGISTEEFIRIKERLSKEAWRWALITASLGVAMIPHRKAWPVGNVIAVF